MSTVSTTKVRQRFINRAAELLRRNGVVGWLVATLVLRWLAKDYPECVERYYSEGMFAVYRYVWDYSVGWLPLPAIIPVTAGWLWWVFSRLRHRWRTTTSISARLLKLLGGTMQGAAVLCLVFLWSWGFNYARLPIEQRQRWRLAPLDSERLTELTGLTIERCVALREQLSGDSLTPLAGSYLPVHLEDTLRCCLRKELLQLGYAAPGSVRARKIPAGWLLHWRVSGIYLPFSGEGHIDAGLHPLSQAFTMAHEMAHGYGFGAEGDCNFLAYLTCANAPSPALQYAGELALLRTLLPELRRANAIAADSFKNTLPVAIRTDWRSIQQYASRYREWFPGVGERVNHAYLRVQGVREGVLSYDRVLLLADAWLRQHARQ